MAIRLTGADKNKLIEQPESGMGYQIVEAVTRDDEPQSGVVFNAELFFPNGESRTVLLSKSHERLLAEATTADKPFKSLRVLPRHVVTASLSESRSTTTHGLRARARPAKEAPIEKTKEGEVFKRFSAYKNDSRLQADGSWSDGTYATTEEDARNVTTGKEAVERYALPNPEPACFVFTGRPHKETDIRRGTVEPDFGHQGGGVEVIFPSGTQSYTVTGPVEIPEE
jgi:hypothetical protein